MPPVLCSRSSVCGLWSMVSFARAPAARSKKQWRQERGRPRPHQPDDRSYDPFRSRKSGARFLTDWVRRRIAALPQRAGNRNGGQERGRPRPHQPDDRCYDPFRSRKSGARFLTDWVRARMPALLQRVRKSNGGQERGRPRPHRPDDRSCTCFDDVFTQTRVDIGGLCGILSVSF